MVMAHLMVFGIISVQMVQHYHWRHYSGGYGDGSGDVALNASNNAWQMIAITWNNDGTINKFIHKNV